MEAGSGEFVDLELSSAPVVDMEAGPGEFVAGPVEFVEFEDLELSVVTSCVITEPCRREEYFPG